MNKRTLVILTVSVLLLCIPHIFLPPSGLSENGWKALFVFAVAVLWWISGVVPVAVTSILAMILLPLFGILPLRKALSFFGNSATFFILGVFILISAFNRSGLSTRIALKILKKLGKDPTKLALGIYFITMFFSFWMVAYAVVAMIFPIVLRILDNCKENDGYSKALLMALLWGAVIGGSATLLGGARGPLAVAMLEEFTGRSISFLKWFLCTLPVVAVLGLIGAFMLTLLTRRHRVDLALVERQLESNLRDLGPMSNREKLIGLVMMGAVVSWMVFGAAVGIATVTITAVVIMFLLGLSDWKEVEEDVNWGVVFMYGGAIALGYALNSTGLSKWLVTTFFTGISSPMLILLTIVLVTLILTELMSNSAVVAFTLPVIITLHGVSNLPPEVLTLAVVVPSGMAMMLPMSTPTVAIVLSSGMIETKDTVKYGAVMILCGAIVTWLAATFYWPRIF